MLDSVLFCARIIAAKLEGGGLLSSELWVHSSLLNLYMRYLQMKHDSHNPVSHNPFIQAGSD